METTHQNSADTAEKKPKNNRFALVFIALILVAGTYGAVKYFHAQHHEETDDAQVVSTISPVIPRVSGYIQEVRVTDNQQVHQGDTLVVLDNRDAQVQLAQAEALLESAKSNVVAAGAGEAVAQANSNTSEVAIGTVEAQIESSGWPGRTRPPGTRPTPPGNRPSTRSRRHRR